MAAPLPALLALLVLASLGLAADIEVPPVKPPLARAANRRPVASAAAASSAGGESCHAEVTAAAVSALAGTTLADFVLLERLGGSPLQTGGAGFVGANAAVYRARCTAPSCGGAEYAVKVMFRPADGQEQRQEQEEEDWGAEWDGEDGNDEPQAESEREAPGEWRFSTGDSSAANCSVGAGSEAASVRFHVKMMILQ